jgi:transmembrane sensor
VDVTVVEGRIELARDKDLSRDISVARAGERAQISRLDQTSDPKIDKIEAAAIQTMLIWQTPMTHFTDVPLRDVVARFNRRNTTQLVLEDADLGERRIGGMIALDQVDAFVRLLAQDGEIVVERQPAGQIGLRRGR